MKGKNLVFIAGGIALPPLRSVIWNCLDLRDEFKDITIVYGARTVATCGLQARAGRSGRSAPDVKLVKTVDPGGDAAGLGRQGRLRARRSWRRLRPRRREHHRPGLRPAHHDQVHPAGAGRSWAFPPNGIYTTLENRMKCGLGKCGRCNIGSKYVCKDGPVFTAAELEALPAEY